MRNTTGVHDVPSVPLFPMGTWYKQDCSGHMGHGGTVTLYKQYSIPSVPVCPVSPTVPVIPVVLGHTGGTWWTDARQ